MFDFYQKRKIRTVVNSPITQGVIFVLICMVGWSAYVRFDIAMEMRERRLQVEAQTAALEARKDVLHQQVEYLTSERGIEAELRRQFDVSLPGEQVVVILEDETVGATVTPLSSNSEQESDRRFWFQFWR
jgi:cell division protein FtsB